MIFSCHRTPHCLNLDVGAGLIGVDLQKHIADAQGVVKALGNGIRVRA